MRTIAHRLAAVTIGLGAVALCVVGAWLNWHGAQVMVPGHAAQAVAGGAVAAELVKLFWMTGAALAFWRGQIASAAAFTFMGLMLHAFSLVCAIGIAAADRDAVLADRGSQQQTHTRWRQAYEDAKQRVEALSGKRPAAEIERKIDRMKQHDRWGADYTDGCTNDTVPRSIAFCDDYRALKAELKASRKLAEARAEMREAREKLDNLTPPQHVDPQAAALANFIPHASKSGMSKWLPTLPSLIVEFVPAIAFLLASVFWRGGRHEDHATVAETPAEQPALGDMASPVQVIGHQPQQAISQDPRQRALRGMQKLAGV